MTPMFSLEKAGTERANENIRIDGYEVNRLFETLDGSEEIEPQTFIKLEWLYLPVLVSYGNERSPKSLHGELSKSPDFFIEVLNWIYTPDNDELVNTDIKDLSDEQIKNRAKQAYELLHTWKQIPGVNESGKIDSEFINSWVKKVRKLAGECGRIEVADMHIGQVLAQYPKKDDNWPPDEICFIIESINTDSIKNNFVCTVFNQRGTVTKSPFEGGEQEKNLAKYFNNLAANHKNKFPIVASVLEKISKSYEQDAKREDERAEKRELEY